MGIVVPFTFPLRPDLMIVIELPEDLTEAEAERISRFVKAVPTPI